MGRNRRIKLLDLNADLFIRPEHIGAWLRSLRCSRQLSLRQMEELTGVSDSEIYRIETGSQECRLESFVLICSGLGVPSGWVTDRLIQANMGWFYHKLESDPAATQLLKSLGVQDKQMAQSLLGNLANICAWTAILIRCSAALRRAKSEPCPHPELEAAFLSFAKRLDDMDSSLERAGIMHSLLDHPITELRNLGIPFEQFLAEHRDRLRTPKAQRKKTTWMWTPWVQRFEKFQ